MILQIYLILGLIIGIVYQIIDKDAKNYDFQTRLFALGMNILFGVPVVIYKLCGGKIGY